MVSLKDKVSAYWDEEPCGSGLSNFPPYTFQYFVDLAIARYSREPFISKYLQFSKWAKRQVLEVGCGAGCDAAGFALADADLTAIDLSPKSVEMTRKHIETFHCKAKVMAADAENLPFGDNSFDFVYSWGVLHHTPDIAKAVSEIKRVLKPWGKTCVMLYNRDSLVSLQMYLRYGLMKGHLDTNLDELYSKYHESPGTKVHTTNEAKYLFKEFSNVEVNNEVTVYDLRYARNHYLPRFLSNFVPKGFGFFNIITANKE